MVRKKGTSKCVSAQDEEKLIGLVQEKPFLYDLTRADYKDIMKKENAWVDISEKMEKETAKFWEGIWKNLRNQFNSYLRKLKLPTGSGAKGRTPYFRHAEAMKFYKDRADEEEETFTNLVFDEDEVLEVQKEVIGNGGPADIDGTPKTTEIASSSSKAKLTKKRKLDPFEEELLIAVKKDSGPEDEYTKFLLSLAPKLARIASKSKKKASECQLRMHQLIFEYESD